MLLKLITSPTANPVPASSITIPSTEPCPIPSTTTVARLLPPVEPVITDVVQVFDLVGLNINGYVALIIKSVVFETALIVSPEVNVPVI